MSAVVEDVPLVVDNTKSSIEPTPSDDIHEKEKDVTITDEMIKRNKEEDNDSTFLVCDQKEEVLDNDDKEPKIEVDTATIEENKDSPKRGLEGDDNDEIPLPLTKTSRTMSVV